MFRIFSIICFASSVILMACPENGENGENGQNGEVPNGEEDTCAGDAQEISFIHPESELDLPVVPCSQTITEDCFEIRAAFCRKVADRTLIEVILEKDGDVIPGSIRYRERDLDVLFRPFAILETRSTYRVTIRSDGVEASMSLNTREANEGAVPDIEGNTFAFGIREFVSPEQLTSVFNTLSTSIPDNLINVNDVLMDPETSFDDQSATVSMVGGAAELGSNPPILIRENPDEGVFTSTGLRLEGRVRGNWFIIGPAPVSLVASGIPFVVRDFVASGIFSEDGQHIEQGFLTGVLNIEDLGLAVGQDLSSICTSSATKEVCDEDGNARLAARIAADTLDIGFDCFITHPINKSIDNPVDISVEVDCTHSLDGESSVFLELCDDSENAPERAKEEGPAANWSCYVEEGLPVDGLFDLDGKRLMFFPDSNLSSNSWYRVGVAAIENETKELRVRHSLFKTRP